MNTTPATLLPAIGLYYQVVSLDNLEHEDIDTADLIGTVVRVVSYEVTPDVCLTEEDPIIECVVVDTGERIDFYKENLVEVLHHCGNCETDFSLRDSRKCPNCCRHAGN